MSALTRRQLLAMAVVGAGATATGGAGLWWTADRGLENGGGTDLIEPEVVSSRDGVLETELEAAPARVRIGDRQASVKAFNGSLPGPTLRVRAGDTIRITMTNGLQDPTNLHVHGLHVSPVGKGDNPFRNVAPGESADYEYTLPADHAPGTYWYHPHRHGTVAEQVAAGLYGAIIVEDSVPLPVTRERTLLVSDLRLDGSGNVAGPEGMMQQMMGREGDIVLANGQVRPQIVAAPGERERWRIINACPSRYLRLSLPGQGVELHSRDLGRLPSPEDITETVLAPGNRVELLVNTRKGSSSLVATPVDRGNMGPGMGRRMMGNETPGAGGPLELLKLEVSGNPVRPPSAVPAGPALRDLRGEPIAGRRTLDFGMGMGRAGSRMGDGSTGMMAFTINGRTFTEGRIDTPVEVGTVEEWTLTNSSPMDHPVHLHVWPMQVIEGADRVAEPRWQDVVNVPAFGRVTVLIAFSDFAGKTVYHCHILDHEDQGMMAILEAS